MVGAKPKILIQLRNKIRRRGYSIRTEMECVRLRVKDIDFEMLISEYHLCRSIYVVFHSYPGRLQTFYTSLHHDRWSKNRRIG
jgi:hypothetical protein